MYNREQRRDSSNDDTVGEDFLEYGFLDDLSEFLGFENGEIVHEFETLINEENTKKLYEAMNKYYERIV
jgi:hypothetical protein